jgi:membrane protein implicated in regulation of membrane protease activity
VIDAVIQQLGPWSWWVLGFLLLVAEIAVPGIFFMWVGIAAIAIGAVSLLHWDSLWWTWQLQFVAFAVLAVLAALIGRQIMAAQDRSTDEPHLNKRGASLVGRTAVLDQPIREGRGRIRLDDTWWIVNGPDLPAGTRVRVTESVGRELNVGKIDDTPSPAPAASAGDRGATKP